jgi:hypothetical protein
VALGVAALLVAACSDAALTSSTTASTAPTPTRADGYTEFGCESPPVEQRTLDSVILLALDPQPVAAGAEAALSLGAAPTRPDDSAAGSGVQWACWNGTAWVGTHMLDLFGGRVFPGKPGVTTTYGGVAVWVPATFLITIPDLPPGWYRLRVDVMGEFGYLAVEVVEAG